MTRAGRVAAIVLAAGRGTRFGSTKQLADVDGTPLIRVTVESVLETEVDDVVVVLGHDAERVRAALAGLAIRTVENQDYDAGMGGSLATGVAALEADDACTVVVLGDQPVAVGVIARLIAEWRAGDRTIVAPAYAGVRGNPVLFDRSIFRELAGIAGDRGARDLLDASPERVALVDFDFTTPVDVDREADIDVLLPEFRRGLSSERRPSGDARQSDRSRPL